MVGMAANPFGAHQVGAHIADHMACRYATGHDVVGRGVRMKIKLRALFLEGGIKIPRGGGWVSPSAFFSRESGGADASPRCVLFLFRLVVGGLIYRGEFSTNVRCPTGRSVGLTMNCGSR